MIIFNIQKIPEQTKMFIIISARKDRLRPKKVRPKENITANIIFNLAQLGIPIRDAEFFDIATYLDLLKSQKSIYEDWGTNRQATQADIDAFLG